MQEECNLIIEEDLEDVVCAVLISKPILDFRMPCGQSVKYESLSDIPKEDTPCPCGNSKHWLVKYLKGEEPI